jgi:hypothetical protein
VRLQAFAALAPALIACAIFLQLIGADPPQTVSPAAAPASFADFALLAVFGTLAPFGSPAFFALAALLLRGLMLVAALLIATGQRRARQEKGKGKQYWFHLGDSAAARLGDSMLMGGTGSNKRSLQFASHSGRAFRWTVRVPKITKCVVDQLRANPSRDQFVGTLKPPGVDPLKCIAVLSMRPVAYAYFGSWFT